MNIENWLPVVGYEGFYEVSNFGRVRSLDRICHSDKRSSQLQKGKILTPRFNKYRQNRCTICLWKNGVVKYCYISRLVLEAFIGTPADDHQAAHWDNDPTNNQLNNLRWASPTENLSDKKRHGTDGTGSRNSVAKLTEDKVFQIKKEYKRLSYHNSNVLELAEKFNVSRGTILNIVKGKSWDHCK